MVDEEKRELIRNRVSIPMYFDKIIMRQTVGYYDDYIVNFEARPWAKCPIHDEDTPSFKYFDDTASFYCYGCRAGGDIFTLHSNFTFKMTGEKPSFDSSLKFLYGFFIDQIQDETVFKVSGKIAEAKPLSTNIEIMKFRRGMIGLESEVFGNKKLEREKKYYIWRTMDSVEKLVGMNKINATEATNFLNSEYGRILK